MKSFIIRVALFITYTVLIFGLLNLWLLAFETSETVGYKIETFTKVTFFAIMSLLFFSLVKQWLLKREARREYEKLVIHYRIEMMKSSMTGFIQDLITDDLCDDVRKDIETFIKEQEELSKKSNKKEEKKDEK